MTGIQSRSRASMWLDRVALVALLAALGFAFLTPAEVTQGNVARLFFIHVPMVIVAYMAFGLTLVGSATYLITRRLRFDHLAVAGAEVGVVFTGLTILVGMIWAKPTWGVYWTWSARLTLTAIMFFVYLGYLALRRAIDDPAARARRAGVYGVLSIVQIPIVHYSVIWWRDIHQSPTLLRPDEMQIDTILFVAFLVALVAFVLLGAALVVRRYRLAVLDTSIREMLDSGAGDLAGDVVAAPSVARPAVDEAYP